MLLSSFILLTSSQAFAGIYLEPYFGYETGKSTGEADIQSVGILQVDTESKGVVFGGKLGYSMMGLAGGLDYSMFKSKDTDKTGQGNDGDSDVTDTGAFVQFTFPIMFKVSGTYIFNSKNKSDDSESTGSGIKIGAGYTGLPFIAINLDYISVKYDDTKVDNAVVNSSDVKSTSYMLSVSLPLDF